MSFRHVNIIFFTSVCVRIPMTSTQHSAHASSCDVPESTTCSPHGRSKVEVRGVPTFGRVLYSTASFLPGDEIFSEEPIIVSLLAPSSKENQILRRVSEQSGLSLVDDFVFLKSYCLSSSERRSQVLDCYVPGSFEVSQSKLLSSLLRVVDVCCLFDWGKSVPKAELQRVLLIKACNAHGFQAQHAGSSALFTLGSKLRHSCCPNVLYTSQRWSDGRGSFVARANINAGDELFISYIDVFGSCGMRADVLRENYLFKCDCRLCCSGTDRYRGLPCPDCSEGVIFRDQETWKCETCGKKNQDLAVPVIKSGREQQLVSEYRLLDQGQGGRSVTALLLEAASELGEMHAVTKLLEKKYIESFLLPTLSLDNVSELVLLTDSALMWANNDPSFLDSTLIQIACAIARLPGYTEFQVPLEET